MSRLGSAYDAAVGDEDRGRLNRSSIHIDFMIGSSEVDVTGSHARGRARPRVARLNLADLEAAQAAGGAGGGAGSGGSGTGSSGAANVGTATSVAVPRRERSRSC